MASFKQYTNCTYCGSKNTVEVITKQSRWSRTVQIMKCKNCNKQNGVKATLNKNNFIDETS